MEMEEESWYLHFHLLLDMKHVFQEKTQREPERVHISLPCTLYAIATLSVISNVEYYQINNDLRIINSSFEKKCTKT